MKPAGQEMSYRPNVLENSGQECSVSWLPVVLSIEEPSGRRRRQLRFAPDVQSDADLVTAVLGGDRASFEVLVRRHERAVLAVALGILRDYHAAQDATQEALVAAYEELGTLRHGARFGAWVLGIARRRAIDMWRKRSRAPQHTAPRDGSAVQGDGRLDDTVDEVFDAIARLPERLRRVVLLRFCDGLSLREIAEATGSPEGTVSSHLSRAIGRLRKSLTSEP
jgi:RNA polymerase sigma-70 factor (ECF subfamily)